MELYLAFLLSNSTPFTPPPPQDVFQEDYSLLHAEMFFLIQELDEDPILLRPPFEEDPEEHAQLVWSISALLYFPCFFKISDPIQSQQVLRMMITRMRLLSPQLSQFDWACNLTPAKKYLTDVKLTDPMANRRKEKYDLCTDIC